MRHFVRETNDSSILEDFFKNFERNPAKSKADIVYKPADNSNWYQTKVAINILFQPHATVLHCKYIHWKYNEAANSCIKCNETATLNTSFTCKFG